MQPLSPRGCAPQENGWSVDERSQCDVNKLPLPHDRVQERTTALAMRVIGILCPEDVEVLCAAGKSQLASFNACEWLEGRTCGAATVRAVTVLRVEECVGNFIPHLTAQALACQCERDAFWARHLVAPPAMQAWSSGVGRFSWADPPGWRMAPEAGDDRYRSHARRQASGCPLEIWARPRLVARGAWGMFKLRASERLPSYGPRGQRSSRFACPKVCPWVR